MVQTAADQKPPLLNSNKKTYSLNQDVFLFIQDGIAQILDFYRGQFYGLDTIGTLMVSLVLEKGSEEAVKYITQTYDATEEQVISDLTKLLQNLEQKQLIIAQGKQSNPFVQWFHHQKKKAGKLLDAILLWFLKRLSSIIHRLLDKEETPSRPTVELLLTLSWISFRLLGWSRTISLWQHWHHQVEGSNISDSGLTQLNKFRPPSPPNLGGESAQKSPRIGGFRGQVSNAWDCGEVIEEVDRLVREAAAWKLFLPMVCKERALVGYHILRTFYSLPATLVVGCDRYPFQIHAWVECDDKIVTDDPEHCETFIPVVSYS
ncbi:MAG: lasso peptide biosynthesis B2 protein [Xenococcaceae cyanobacterium]